MDNKAFYDENGKPIVDQLNGKAGNGYAGSDQKFANGDKPKELEIAVAEEEEEDPWKVTSLSQDYTPWSELDQKQKVLRVIAYLVKAVLVVGCLYMFICSLDFLSSAFRLLGGEAAGQVFQQSDIMTNPIAGLMMGVLVTVLVQSSSTSTSIIVSMVGAGILDIKTSIPMIMGANIGTSVTNTIVAIGQISDKGEFRRAFAGATVHDMFNWLAVLILLPIEIITGYLFYMTQAIVDSLPLKTNEAANQDMLKVITEPFTKLIIQVDKGAITAIAKGDTDKYPDKDHMIMKVCCDKKTPMDCCEDKLDDFPFIELDSNYTSTRKTAVCEEVRKCVNIESNVTESCVADGWTYGNQEVAAKFVNCTIFGGNTGQQTCCSQLDTFQVNDNSDNICGRIANCFPNDTSNMFTLDTCKNDAVYENGTVVYHGETFSCSAYTRQIADYTCYKECDFLFKDLYPELNDKQIGGILLVIALAILCICLVAIVKLLHSLLKGPMAIIIKKFINADFPGPCAHFTGYLAILVGAGLTIVVQSSSIFTSTLTPLVGIGVIEIDRMYPLTLGSNIGTTTTAILAALASGTPEEMKNPLQVAFAHLFFNLTAIAIYYPISYLRFPIPLAKFLGNTTAKYRWFAIVYLFIMFFMFPAAVFALSIPGWYVLLAVLGPIALLVIIIAIIKVTQAKRPSLLPTKLQDWKFLPKPLRSLEPYDNVMKKFFFCKRFQNEEEPINKSNGYIDNTRL